MRRSKRYYENLASDLRIIASSRDIPICKAAAEAIDELAKLLRAWQPIQTVPRDRPVLAFQAAGVKGQRNEFQAEGMAVMEWTDSPWTAGLSICHVGGYEWECEIENASLWQELPLHPREG